MIEGDRQDAQGEMLIRREERKLERDRARAAALEENMKSTIAAFLKDASVRKSLAADAMAATKDPSRRDTIFEKAASGVYKDDLEVITGREDRPWER